MTLQLMNEEFLTKITIIKVFLCHVKSVCTYISGSRCMWWQKTTTHIHTYETTTVTLTVHVCRGLILILSKHCQNKI